MFDFFKRKKNKEEQVEQIENKDNDFADFSSTEEYESNEDIQESEESLVNVIKDDDSDYGNLNEKSALYESQEDFEDEEETAYDQSISSENDKGFFAKLKDGLSKTRDQFTSNLKNLFTRNVKIDDDLYDELEEILISADIGMTSTVEIVDELREEIKKKKY